MYLKNLRKMDRADLEAIKMALAFIDNSLEDLESLDRDLKKKRRGFNPQTRRELKQIRRFVNVSEDKINRVIEE